MHGRHVCAVHVWGLVSTDNVDWQELRVNAAGAWRTDLRVEARSGVGCRESRVSGHPTGCCASTFVCSLLRLGLHRDAVHCPWHLMSDSRDIVL